MAITRPTELWQLTAVELASAVRAREVSSVDVVRSCLDRVDETNPVYNALADLRPEEALTAARQADEALAAA